MLAYLARRLMLGVPTLLAVGMLSFLLIRITPGDPIRMMLGATATPEAMAFWREHFGLDQPLLWQFGQFITRIVAFDFGTSIQLKAPVGDLLSVRTTLSAALLFYSVVIAIVLAVPLATVSALRAGGAMDLAVRLAAMTTFCMPAFWLALVLVLMFSIGLGWFPTSGLGAGPFGALRSLTLPAFTIGLYLAPILIRTLRASILETLQSDFVMAAHARGLKPGVVLVRYVLPNSLSATVTVMGLSLGYLIGGAVVVENVFALPGLAVMYLGVVVEVGPRIMSRPLHPYTQALLSAAPTLKARRDKSWNRITLAGDPPSPMTVPSGCRFHPRCALAREICQTEEPPLRALPGMDVAVACHFAPEGTLQRGETVALARRGHQADRRELAT